jgi:hypothetical protein
MDYNSVIELFGLQNLLSMEEMQEQRDSGMIRQTSNRTKQPTEGNACAARIDGSRDGWLTASQTSSGVPI